MYNAQFSTQNRQGSVVSSSLLCMQTKPCIPQKLCSEHKFLPTFFHNIYQHLSNSLSIKMFTFTSLCHVGIVLPCSKRGSKTNFSVKNVKFLPHTQFQSLNTYLQAMQHPK